MNSKRADIIVGAFVLGGVVLIMAGIFSLGGGLPGGKHTYLARYSNVATLAPGSIVKYHGLVVGRVQTVEIDKDMPAKIRVTLTVHDSTPVTRGTIAEIRKVLSSRIAPGFF